MVARSPFLYADVPEDHVVLDLAHDLEAEPRGHVAGHPGGQARLVRALGGDDQHHAERWADLDDELGVQPGGLAVLGVGEQVLRLIEDRHPSLPATALLPDYLRSATAYGLSPRIRFDIVLNNLVAWAVTTGLIYLKSDGSPWRPIIHIEDISRAFIAALEAPVERVHNEAFNVG